MPEFQNRRDWLYLPPELESRTRFLPEADPSVISTIGCGVLFFMAFWSIYARQAFEELKRVLAEVDSEARLELVVVDIDGFRDVAQVPEFRAMHVGAGYGETAWVIAGQILSMTRPGVRSECFAPNTRALLEECRV
jgi:hypothetical protein